MKQDPSNRDADDSDAEGKTSEHEAICEFLISIYKKVSPGIFGGSSVLPMA